MSTRNPGHQDTARNRNRRVPRRISSTITQSENLDLVWAPTRATITANSVVAPDGSLTADTINEDGTAASNHFILRAFIAEDNTDYTFSGHFLPGLRDWVELVILSQDGEVNGQFFNVTTGAEGTSFGADFIDGGIKTSTNGWYRPWVRANSGAAGTSEVILIGIADADFGITFNGLSQASFYGWGMQHEKGALTDYVATANTLGSSGASNDSGYRLGVNDAPHIATADNKNRNRFS